MMTSYLCIVLNLKSVSQDCLPDLTFLVRFGVASVTMDVQSLTDAFLSKSVKTAPDSRSTNPRRNKNVRRWSKPTFASDWSLSTFF